MPEDKNPLDVILSKSVSGHHLNGCTGGFTGARLQMNSWRLIEGKREEYVFDLVRRMSYIVTLIESTHHGVRSLIEITRLPLSLRLNLVLALERTC